MICLRRCDAVARTHGLAAELGPVITGPLVQVSDTLRPPRGYATAPLAEKE